MERQWIDAVLFDRDDTLVHDEPPYNGDPTRVRPVAGARLALDRLRAAGVRLGVVSNQSGIARGLVSAEQVRSVDARIVELLGPVDDYVEVFDPYAQPELVAARLSDDLSQITSDLLHGLAHQAAGRRLEALWWCQFSYLATWGPAASAALRALQSLVAHVRLEVPLEADPEADDLT